MRKRFSKSNRGLIIRPLQLTRFWYRRICEAVVFISGAIIVLYFWTFYFRTDDAGLLVSSQSIIMAAISFMVGAVFYVWTPKKFMTPTAMAAYILMAATTACLVVTSGGIESPFIALWILVAIFAGVFGIWGLSVLFVAGSYYLVIALVGGELSQEIMVRTLAAGWLPLIASFILWHGRSAARETQEKAYRTLETELNEVASKAEVVINAIADGVIAIDQTGTIQLINPAAQEITGWGKQDATKLNYKSVLKLIDKKGSELVPGTDPVQLVLNNNQEVRTNDLSLVTNGGKKLMLSVVVSPVGEQGSGAIIVFRDITKEKAAEREQAEFISTASHEMRTPVASIEGYLSLALNPTTATVDEKARDFINKAHEATQHLGRLFQDLLDVSKTEDGRLPNNPSVVDVVQFVHDVVEGLRPAAENKNLHLVYKPLPDDQDGAEGSSDRQITPVYYVMADPDHLREVVNNLTENAIKYTLNGDVTVDITGDENHVTISVADSGIGIPAEDLPHLFQKFYRVDNTDTREIGGTGLGLYLSRRLTEVMEGRLYVESEYQKGSTFFVELPRMSHERATNLLEQTAHKGEDAVATATPAAQTNFVVSPHSATDILNDPHLNTPLVAIEQAPEQFTQRFERPINVPPRKPDQKV